MKKGKSHIIGKPRKAPKAKGKKGKIAVLDPKTSAGLGKPWPLSYPNTGGKNQFGGG